MIADILPLRALPRGLAFFSYTVPTQMQDNLKLGQCVKIPFQSSTMLGMVGKIFPHKKADNLKSIIEIINPTPLIGPDYLDWLEKLAKFYGVSLPTLLKRALPPLQPNKINQEEIGEWKIAKKKSSAPDYFWYKNEIEHAEALSNYGNEKIIIIVPEIALINSVKNNLSPERQAGTQVWGNQDSVKSERELWFKIRNGEIKTLITTRSALWWPLCQNFDRIIIDFEHDENHKHWDQSPRFTTKDVAKLHAKYFGLAYTEMSFSPSVTSYFFIQEKKYTLLNKKTGTNFLSPTIVYPDSGKKSAPVFSPTLEAIKKIIHADPTAEIILIYNQTKPGKFGFCRDCGHTIPTPLPVNCPDCQGITLVELGNTINSVAKFLQKELGFASEAVEILTFDKANTELSRKKSARIIVGTWALLGAIKYDTIALAAILDFTRQALFSEYLAHEQLRHRIRQLQFFLQPRIPLLIQSETAEHPVLVTLQNDEVWFQSQLTERASLGYPPYSYLVRYLVPGQTEAEAEQNARQAITKIQTGLTKERKNLTIQGPLPASTRHQGKAWAIVMVKIAEPDIVIATTWTNQFFLSTTKIDPNPISLFSPH